MNKVVPVRGYRGREIVSAEGPTCLGILSTAGGDEGPFRADRITLTARSSIPVFSDNQTSGPSPALHLD
jgi:hypothetical protein